MIITIKDLKDSNKQSKKVCEDRYRQMLNGTYTYDGSMPKSCVDALIEHKLKTSIIIEALLNTRQDDEVVMEDCTTTEFMRLINTISNSNSTEQQMKLIGEFTYKEMK